MYVVIVAHAPDLDLVPFKDLIDTANLVIAADGGALALLRGGLLPQVVIGDLDSLDADNEAVLIKQSVEVHRFPRAKDETDLELALLLAAERGATKIDVLGALGGRWDHTLANVGLLTHPRLQGRRVQLVADRQVLFLVHDTATIEGQIGDTVSLLPLTGEAQGVTTQGLLYPLDDATLHYYQARGVSNVLLESPAHITVRQGWLLVVHHDDGGAYQWNTEMRDT